MLRGIGISARMTAFLGVMMLIVPYIIVVVTSFDAGSSAAFPPAKLSLRWYLNAFDRPAFREGFVLSLTFAVASASAAVTIGTAAAFALTRVRFPGRDAANTLLAAPLMIPQIVTGLGFLILVTRFKLPNHAGIIVAHTILAVPFVVRIVSARLLATSVSLEEAAMTLGATRLQTLRRITLPIIAESMVAAGIFAFAISFDNFYISVFLAQTRGTLPVEIYAYARTEGDPTIAAISAMLILFSAVALGSVSRLFDLETLARVTR
ncbi:MAG: ABC transporter permease [Alphaproteobacteria bacterium]|nr:ABC transporter permease [Alphaproteobacteria bacterium]